MEINLMSSRHPTARRPQPPPLSTQVAEVPVRYAENLAYERVLEEVVGEEYESILARWGGSEDELLTRAQVIYSDAIRLARGEIQEIRVSPDLFRAAASPPA